MLMEENKLLEILRSGNYVSEGDLKKAEHVAKTRRGSVVDFLLSQGLLNTDLLGQAIAESYKVGFADLNSAPPSQELVQKIPVEFAREHTIVAWKETAKQVVVATDQPDAPDLKSTLAPFFPKKTVVIAYGHSDEIRNLFVHYRKGLDVRFEEILKQGMRVAPQLLDQMISDAVLLHASDVHLEPQGKEVVVRFRVDGLLTEVGRIDALHYENVLNRIKVQTHLRTDEHLSAQDGAMRFEEKGISTDIRVSIVPVLDGEKVVMRMLSEHVRRLTLQDLGLSERDQALIRETAEKPYGMIMVTGPTGSGKTTTLYGLIKVLNTPDVNIATIEDPVEYKMAGVNHIQVNTQTNLTFAKGLRSIVRQDPDIILVGEIRDTETAEIAVNAALTGHLLLSTFHANDAASSIPRLLNMGVEPFLLASTLNLVVAQRLARRVCESCRQSRTFDRASLEKFIPSPERFFSSEKCTFYVGKGCSSCGETGYRGRIALFEILQIGNEMQDLFLKQPSAKEIWEFARAKGARSMFEDGIEKVLAGVTTVEELVRVVPVPVSYEKATKNTQKIVAVASETAKHRHR